MKKIFLIILPTLVFNFLKVKFELDVLNIENIYFVRKKIKEYNIIYADINSWTHTTYILKVDAEKDEIIQEQLMFKDRLESLKKQEN